MLIPNPRVYPEDPRYIRACKEALEEPTAEMVEAFAAAVGSRRFAVTSIAAAVIFPGEIPRAAGYIKMLSASARSAGWANFAIKKTLPVVVAGIVDTTIRTGNGPSCLETLPIEKGTPH